MILHSYHFYKFGTGLGKTTAYNKKQLIRSEFLSAIMKTGYKLIEPFILCKASLSFYATRSHVTRLKSACVRVSLEARNWPMRSERKIANGTWQRFFFATRDRTVAAESERVSSDEQTSANDK